MRKIKDYIIFVVVLVYAASVCYGYSTDELIGKAVNVTSSLARGNVSSAASQAIGGYNIPLMRGSNMYVTPSNVGFQQNIKPLGVNAPYLNVGTDYQASFSPLNPTNASQSIDINSGNPYISNNTSIPIPTKLKKNY